MDQLAWDGPESAESFHAEWAQIVKRSEEGRNHFFVIVDDVARVPAGACSVRCKDTAGDLGIWLGEPFQGRGLGTSAIAELVTYSLERLELSRLEATIFVGNWPSRRAFEKNGFLLERTLERSSLKLGVLRDEWRLALPNASKVRGA